MTTFICKYSGKGLLACLYICESVCLLTLIRTFSYLPAIYKWNCWLLKAIEMKQLCQTKSIPQDGNHFVRALYGKWNWNKSLKDLLLWNTYDLHRHFQSLWPKHILSFLFILKRKVSALRQYQHYYFLYFNLFKYNSYSAIFHMIKTHIY